MYITSNKSVLSCSLCNKSFNKKYNLERHKCNDKDNLVIINKDSVYQCDFCRQQFFYQSRLQRHLSSVRGECYKLLNNKYENTNNITFMKSMMNTNLNSSTINNNTILNNPIINNNTTIINGSINIVPNILPTKQVNKIIINNTFLL